MIQIGSGVSEIWPGKLKSRGAFVQAGAFIRQITVNTQDHPTAPTQPHTYRSSINTSSYVSTYTAAIQLDFGHYILRVID